MSNAEDNRSQVEPDVSSKELSSKSCCESEDKSPAEGKSCCSPSSEEESCCSSKVSDEPGDGHTHVHAHTHTGCGCSSQSEAALPDVTNWKGSRSFRVEGLCCAEEISILRRVVGPVLGDSEYMAFDVLNGKMIISPVARAVPDELIIKAVNSTGMKAALFIQQEAADARAKQHRRLGTFTIASGALWAAALVVQSVLYFSSTSSADVFSVFETVPTGPVEILYMLAIVAGLRLVAPKLVCFQDATSRYEPVDACRCCWGDWYWGVV